MDIEALRSFIAFVETGSFTRASQQVYLTQSAVSQQMKKLEEQTGNALFYKVGRQLSLTEEGKFLLTYARQIVSLNDDALIQLQKKENIRALKLGCPDDYVQAVLPRVVAIIQSINPNIHLDILCANSMQLRKLLDKGELDLAIITGSSQANEGYFLLEDDSIWAFNGDKDRLRQLFNEQELPLILYDKSCHYHSSAVHGLSKLNIPAKVIAVSQSSNAIISMVQAGMGITALARISKGNLVEIDNDILNDVSLPTLATLPMLPTVRIEITLSAKLHPNFGRTHVEELVKRFKA